MAGSTPTGKGPFRRRGSSLSHLPRLRPPTGSPWRSQGADPQEGAPQEVPPPGARDERGRAASLAAAARRAARKGGQGARNRLLEIVERIIENAPRVPVRDLDTLRRQFPGLGPEQIADRLVAGAMKGSAAVGAGVGTAAMLPVPPAMTAELATEIVGVATVEIKLIAELHEVYGLRAPGTAKQRATAYLTAWTEERGIDVAKPASVNAALGGQLKRQLRQQILKRSVRNMPNLLPFMVGAAVGAVMNRRDTKRLAEKVRRDLRKHQVPWDALPSAGPHPQLEEPGSPKALQKHEEAPPRHEEG
ncbi:hypothetical protein [Streptomyces sp. KR80]|uniref:hypothetical protein n=1 Tax=Streptomyces sp. KR80 TaxID=3457426 RepID=UPI003FD1D897